MESHHEARSGSRGHYLLGGGARRAEGIDSPVLNRAPLRVLWGLALCWLTLGLACSSELEADPTLQLFAASSATDAMRELRDRFVDSTGQPVELTFGASSTLARQIQRGARADLFLSASQQWADASVEATSPTEANPTSLRCRVDLLNNRLVVVVPIGSTVQISRLDDLLQEQIELISIADPLAVPAGIYAREALESAGLWQALRPRLVPGNNVRTALRYVSSGAAAAGLVYATDALAEDRVEIAFEVSPEDHSAVTYSLLWLGNRERDASRGRELFDFLHSEEAREVFERHGFGVVAAIVPGKPSPAGGDLP